MTTHSIPVRLDLDRYATGFGRAMAHLDKAATKELDAANIDPLLRELVRVRASQLNGCAYCVDMHTATPGPRARPSSACTPSPSGAEAPFFTDRERAALAFTESVTRLASTHVPDEAYAAVAAEFAPEEVGALLSLIVAINAWNALSVASRSWAPEVQGSAA